MLLAHLKPGRRFVAVEDPELTGVLVRVNDMDPTDQLDNSTIGTANPSGPPDGIADYPFNFAQQGRAAGR